MLAFLQALRFRPASSSTTRHRTSVACRFRRSALVFLMMLFMGIGTLNATPLKVGIIVPMSGPFAAYGKQILNGAKLYLKQNGTSAAGREVELIVRDDTGIAPDLSKRLAREL
ncbi:MAG TPA: ABC transporter substrate-binding protein, partial [Burkholderiaceae bacterium]|nr:ABC transporter substrate-binding protein [Burkholderiaceae bacterium]